MLQFPANSADPMLKFNLKWCHICQFQRHVNFFSFSIESQKNCAEDFQILLLNDHVGQMMCPIGLWNCQIEPHNWRSECYSHVDDTFRVILIKKHLLKLSSNNCGYVCRHIVNFSNTRGCRPVSVLWPVSGSLTENVCEAMTCKGVIE